jgi:ABC-type antimicrobial peptide transport system permease subunit
MSSAGFPINDLMRRRLQTSLTISILTLSVASTLFLLLFSNRLGVGIASTSDTLTVGLNGVFSQFILFIGVLIFVIGAVLTSFIVFLMLSQRTHDFGLIKAAGCPNSLVAGYFMTELLTVTVAGCILGIIFGFLMDFVAANLVFSAYTLPNFWFAPLVFVAFFVLSLFFGLRPILKAANMSAIDALSPVNYYGLKGETKHKPLSRRAITLRIALRSLYRRQSASLRIVFLLSIVFILLTVSIAGGTIARDTTISSIETPVGKDTIAIAQSTMINEYRTQLLKFSKTQENTAFNYSDPQLAVPQTLIEQLKTLSAVEAVDPRLVLAETVKEVPGFELGQDSSQTQFVGGHRQGQSIVVGLNPGVSTGSWSLKGHFLSNSTSMEAVVGDSLAETMYVPNPNNGISLSDPLMEGVGFENVTFKIVGVGVDPLNNGYVTYVPIESLQNATGLHEDNLVLVQLSSSADRNSAIGAVRSMVQASGYDLEVFDLGAVVEQNTVFLSSTWQTIMLLPIFTLVSAAICLVGFMMLSVDEQHQEFAILRAVGAKPAIIISISAIQCAIVLFSSFGTGISLGIIVTSLILMANPIITATTIAIIAFWLISALIATFLLSLYPAFKMAKTSILKIMS